jgi:hypothetical protein
LFILNLNFNNIGLIFCIMDNLLSSLEIIAIKKYVIANNVIKLPKELALFQKLYASGKSGILLALQIILKMHWEKC